MLKPFLRVLAPSQALELLRIFGPTEIEQIPTIDGLFRVLAEPISSTEDMPGFSRSTMDGFAVRSKDTFGSSEGAPALLQIVGEVSMGEIPDIILKKGEAVRIWTGGALPSGSDAVVMIEHTEEIGDNSLEVFKAVAPFESVVRQGEDFRNGETFLEAGFRLRPQDLGLLAAMGRQTVSVYRKPNVAVISSGDEIIPIDQEPLPGCIRDVNRYTITSMIQEAHANPVWIGIAPDNLEAVSSSIDRGINTADVVLISGGSSMGSRDHVIEAIRSHKDAEILVHGVSVSPGKPLILGRVGRKPIAGLPGHPVSAMVCFEQFIVPLIRRLEGENVMQPFLRPSCQALLSRNIPSREGRMDFVRVRLLKRKNETIAVPVPAKSGMISSMVRADGVITIDPDCEGLYKGQEVTVNLFARWTGDRLEKEHLFGHEDAGRSSGALFESAQQEKLSRI